ncbi:DUF968 domain-containing protein [Citrobacter freundii]|uniref:DUF968 domain-containing protein n=1 Tax=Citrobacter freundii TaxID=546 RepID=UPI000B64E350|nr:DUF968 domain-containing protein [Citrobacter freundii]MEB6429242.1 DUF968 domain-containing protein [Citrobacter freundii]OUE68704.1 hypothetical protein AZ007_001776 [Citrobacter freundii]
MRALLNPIIIRELDQVILRPGRSLMSLFYGPVIIAPAGEMEAGRKPGLLPQEQPLLLDPAYSSFWMDPEVLRAAGGSVQSWVRKFNVCQWNHGADEYHHPELTTARYEQSGLCLCWHHDRVLVDQPPALVADIARQNAAQYILESVCSHFRYPDHHIVTISDLGCWALVKRVASLLPDTVIRKLLCMPSDEPIKPVYRESELVINPPDPPAIIAAAAEDAPVLVVTIDADAPAQYMHRPKIPRWQCQAYTDWVKIQTCCGCGEPGDDPHHLVGHGFGGTGMKAGDFHVMPLCRICHRELHDNVVIWESQHGSQLEHIFRLQHRALGLGVIVTGCVS